MTLTHLPDGVRLTYDVNYEARYWPAIRESHKNRPSITVQTSAKPGDPEWVGFEFEVEEHTWPTAMTALRLGIFEDAWSAFALVPELFAALAAPDGPRELDDFRALLDRLGAVDTTLREPYPAAAQR